MKWQNSLAFIIGFGGLIQLIKWILDSLKVDEAFYLEATFFLSSIFAILIIFILIVNQLQQENEKIKEFLKPNGFVEERSILEKMVNYKNKKGMIDSRLLWIPVAFIFLYLLYKLFTS